MRSVVEFVGLSVVVVGLGLMWLPLGVVAGGLVLVAVANVLGGDA